MDPSPIAQTPIVPSIIEAAPPAEPATAVEETGVPKRSPEKSQASPNKRLKTDEGTFEVIPESATEVLKSAVPLPTIVSSPPAPVVVPVLRSVEKPKSVVKSKKVVEVPERRVTRLRTGAVKMDDMRSKWHQADDDEDEPDDDSDESF